MERCNFLFSTCLTSSEFSGYRRCPTSQLQVPISANGTLQKPGSSLGKRGRCIGVCMMWVRLKIGCHMVPPNFMIDGCWFSFPHEHGITWQLYALLDNFGRFWYYIRKFQRNPYGVARVVGWGPAATRRSKTGVRKKEVAVFFPHSWQTSPDV